MNDINNCDSDYDNNISSLVDGGSHTLSDLRKEGQATESPGLSLTHGLKRSNFDRNLSTESEGLTDYFNLNSSSDDDDNYTVTEGCDHDSTAKLPIDQSEDSPVLSFWNDDVVIPSVQSTPDENCTNCNFSCFDSPTPLQNLTEPDCIHVKPKLKGYVSKKCKYDTTISQCKQTGTSKDEEEATLCYRVHKKVAPLLSRENVRFSVSKNITKTLKGHAGVVNKIAWCTPQYSHIIASASMDKKVNLWNIFQENKNFIKSYAHHSKAVTDISWSNTGKNILTCSYDKTATVVDIETGSKLNVCDHQNFVSVGKFHPVNFHYFVTGTLDKLYCWDTRNTVRPAKTYVYKDKFGQVQDLAFSKDGSQFFTCNDQVSRDSADKNIMAWDFNKHVAISNQIYQERFTCTRLKLHPFNNEFLAQSQGGYIAQFSTQRPYKMNKCKRFEGHKVMGHKIGFDVSSDGQYIVSGSADGLVHFYHYSNTRTAHKINLGDRAVCLDIACHPVLNSTVAVSTCNAEIIILK